MSTNVAQTSTEHAWWDAMKTISKLVFGYRDTSTAYRVDILKKWETMVSKDACDEDVRSSSSQGSPLAI